MRGKRRILRRRQRQAYAIGQRGGAKDLQRRTDRAIDIRRAAMAFGDRAVIRCDRRGAVAVQQHVEILRMKMPITRDELDQHRRQREPMWSAGKAGPPEEEAARHRSENKRKVAAVTSHDKAMVLGRAAI